MNRRRVNKSNKIPNVKLRPAIPVSSSTSSINKAKPYNAYDSVRTHDSGFDSELDSSLADIRIPRPFRGIILCATGISDKASLFKQAMELGAQPLSDLTDKVTHLLAVEPGSAKYKCALDNKIPIMHPSWISDSYEIWLRGDDVDFEESARSHRLPIFSNVVLCVSGIDDVEKRKEINRRVTDEGGAYVKNIERPVRVTHLLCASGADAMTEKMRYAVKFNKHKEADIRMVWEDWFWDSLKAGGRYDEDSYDIAKPRPNRQLSQAPTSPPRSSSPAGIRDDEPQAVAPQTSGPKPPANNEDDEEVALAVKRVPAVTLQLWSGILRPRGFEMQGGKLMRSPSKSQNPPRDNLAESSPTKAKAPARRHDTSLVPAGSQPQSTLAAIRRTQSSAAAVPSKDVPSERRLFQRVPTTRRLESSEQKPDPPQSETIKPLPIASSSTQHSAFPHNEDSSDTKQGSEVPKGLFCGLSFRILGEAQTPHVKAALEAAGGSIIGDSSADTADFIIVRLAGGSKLYKEEADEQVRRKYRTECWLERCFSEERICSADDHVSFTPLTVETPIPDARLINLSVSGLEDFEGLWVQRLTRALGINLDPTFSRRTTHLLCPTREGPKFAKAQEWNIPVVDMTWLTDIAASGKVSVRPTRRSESRRTSSVVLASPPSSKGKGQAVDQLEHPDAGAQQPLQPQITDGDQLHHPRQGSPLGGDDDHLEPFRQPVVLWSDAKPRPQSHDILPQDEEPFRLAPSGLLVDDGPHRSMSLAELREDMQNTRIPSSATPSPIKVSSNPPSQAKVSSEIPKPPQAGSTSSLGKRTSIEDSGTGHSTRLKRSRVPPANAQASDADDVPAVPAPRYNLNHLFEDDAWNVCEPFAVPKGDANMLAEAPAADLEDIARVTYEDPAQNDEKMRLMRLLESQRPQQPWEADADHHTSDCASDENSKGSVNSTTNTSNTRRRKAPRRSARLGGF